MSKNSAILDRVEKAISERKKNSLFRSLAQSSSFRIDCSTNSYLSLHNNPDVIRSCLALSGTYYSGNLASRLIANRSALYETLETDIAQWKHTDAALVFTSGYAANTGVIQALCTHNTGVFSDKYNHASIIDGIRLSDAVMTRYAHCDMDDLSVKLKHSPHKEKIIITDTVFSMDGDVAPLFTICELAERYDALVMVDEAHASGIFGDTLTGLAEALHVEKNVDISIGTLSKAFAGLGGFAATNALLKDFLVNHARSLIYSTGLPHTALAWDCAALRYIKDNAHIGKEVLERASRFRNRLHEAGFATGSSSTPIVPCFTGDPEKALALSGYLSDRGIRVPAIRPPTVPQGTDRLRFSVFSEFTDDKQDEVISLLKTWKADNE